MVRTIAFSSFITGCFSLLWLVLCKRAQSSFRGQNEAFPSAAHELQHAFSFTIALGIAIMILRVRHNHDRGAAHVQPSWQEATQLLPSLGVCSSRSYICRGANK